MPVRAWYSSHTSTRAASVSGESAAHRTATVPPAPPPVILAPYRPRASPSLPDQVYQQIGFGRAKIQAVAIRGMAGIHHLPGLSQYLLIALCGGRRCLCHSLCLRLARFRQGRRRFQCLANHFLGAQAGEVHQGDERRGPLVFQNGMLGAGAGMIGFVGVYPRDRIGQPAVQLMVLRAGDGFRNQFAVRGKLPGLHFAQVVFQQFAAAFQLNHFQAHERPDARAGVVRAADGMFDPAVYAQQSASPAERSRCPAGRAAGSAARSGHCSRPSADVT